MDAPTSRRGPPTAGEIRLLRADTGGTGCGPSRPWELGDEAWERLEPDGFYVRRAREPFLYLMSCLLLPAAIPVAILIALVNARIHGSPRRILFRQERVGRRGRIFVLHKFRTMRDSREDDRSRVTRFGRFLRNTHLDELPQLWDVLRGEMSLVGPRPEMIATEAWAAGRWPKFSRRLVLRPGLTGLAQITQGYASEGDEAAYRRKLALNRLYLARISFSLDCAILARTALWMLTGRGWRSVPGDGDRRAATREGGAQGAPVMARE